MEQTETPEQQKARKGKIIKREVCEILTKGTLIPQEFLGSLQIIFYESWRRGNQNTSSIDVGICYSDFSTSDVYIGRFINDRKRSRLRTLIFQIDPSEVTLGKSKLSKETLSLKTDGKKAVLSQFKEQDMYDQKKTKDMLKEQKYWGGYDKMPKVLQTAWDHGLTMSAFGGIL